jgi:hypothetical protein
MKNNIFQILHILKISYLLKNLFIKKKNRPLIGRFNSWLTLLKPY